MHRVLMNRADVLMNGAPGSPEEAELAAIVPVIEA
jgi:hypothetical protein